MLNLFKNVFKKSFKGHFMKYLCWAIVLLLIPVNNLHADGHENKKGYVLAFLNVQDKEVMQEYRKMTKPIIKEHGGKLLAASPYPDMKEGYIPAVAAIIEFPSREDAKKCYDSQENEILHLVIL